jgi:hypothetical protein
MTGSVASRLMVSDALLVPPSLVAVQLKAPTPSLVLDRAPQRLLDSIADGNGKGVANISGVMKIHCRPSAPATHPSPGGFVDHGSD